MATFHVQVEGLTGLAIDGSSTPTEDELTEFLKDGVHDVTSKCITAKPGSIQSFLRKSAEQTSNGFDVGTSNIVSVIREAGVANDFRNCTKIPVGLKSLAADVNSLHFASKYNPVYYIDQDTEVDVLPDPAGSAVNGFRVYYVNDVPTDETNGASLTQGHSDIKYFPQNKVYLVVLYAAIKCLEHKMAAYTHTDEDTELTQAIAGNIAAMKSSYAGAFGAPAPRQQPQQGARR